MDRHPEVLVVGAGPVGMCAALALVRRGVQVTLVDEGWRPASHSYATALHPASLALLDELGLLPALQARGQRVEAVTLHEDGQACGTLPLYTLHTTHPYVLALPQAALEEELEAALRAAGVRVLWNHRVAGVEAEGERPRVVLERLEKASTGYSYATTVWEVDRVWEMRPGFVIAADGHRSTVRRCLDGRLAPAGPLASYLAAELTLAGQPSGHDLRVLMGSAGVDVVWPLADGACRCTLRVPTVASPPDRFKERALWSPNRPADTDLRELVAARVPGLPAGWEARWWGVATFAPGLVTRWGTGRVWLAGDAAHVAQPLGVQSLNVGLREAVALAGAAQQAVTGADPARALFDYAQRFTGEWRVLLGLDAVVSSDPWVREHAPRLLPALPASGPVLVELLQRLGASAPFAASA